MPKKRAIPGGGKRSAATFTRLVSPLGQGAEGTPVYSPSREVTGAHGQPTGSASKAESAKNSRRGG